MIELLLLAGEDLVDTVSDALMELDALSVSVEDADAGTEAEQALFGEPGLPPPKGGWGRSTLRALFPTEEAATEAATLLLAQPWASEVHVVAMQPVPDQDWVRLTQSQFHPVEITPEFWIVPTWHEPPAQAREGVLVHAATRPEHMGLAVATAEGEHVIVFDDELGNQDAHHMLLDMPGVPVRVLGHLRVAADGIADFDTARCRRVYRLHAPPAPPEPAGDAS